MDVVIQQSSAQNESTVKMVLPVLQLEKYEELFMKKKLSLDTFLNLNEEDLEYLGITDQEDQKKLINGVQPFRSTYKEIDCSEPLKVEAILGNSIYQLFVIATQMRQLRKKLNGVPRPPNTLINASVPASTAIKHFIGVIRDQIKCTRDDLIEALPRERVVKRVYYIRRAVAIGILGSIVYASVLVTRLFRRGL